MMNEGDHYGIKTDAVIGILRFDDGVLNSVDLEEEEDIIFAEAGLYTITYRDDDGKCHIVMVEVAE